MAQGVPPNKIIISITTRKYGWLLENPTDSGVGAPIIKNLEEKNLTSVKLTRRDGPSLMHLDFFETDLRTVD